MSTVITTVACGSSTVPLTVGVVFVVERVFTVTPGPLRSYVTVSSFEVEATLPLPAGSLATLAAMETVTVPSALMPVTETVKSVWEGMEL